MSLVFISGIAIFYIVSFLSTFVFSVAALLFLFPNKFGYITERLITFIDPSKGDSFQSAKALDAIRQGGLKGQGMGEGTLKDKVPEAHTDYIIAVITEEYGSIISILIVCIFLYITYRIIKICMKKNNDNIKVALSGLSSLLIFQTFIHIGVNTSLLPTTGMTLPFLSYGGSSLIGSAVLAGVILNYTKNRINNEE
jgi:cell division protein FtsW